MSLVLLRQPSDSIDIFVIDYYIFVLFLENEYDDGYYSDTEINS